MRADVDPLNATNYYTDRPLGLWVAQDLDEPERYAPYLMQAHVAATLRLAGFDKAEERAARVMALETRIARSHWSQLDTGDVQKANNTWTKAQFAQRAPGLDWEAFFAAAGLAQPQKVKVWQTGAVTGLSALAASEPMDAWRDYLAFHAVDRAAPWLSKAFVDQHFAFHGQALSGTPQQSPRWKKAVAATNGALGDAVGRMYVARYFPPAAKAEVEAMVTNIKAAFARRIEGLAWMAPETKAEAQAKLAAMRVGVGYPDKWRDYSGLTVRTDDAVGNIERSSLVEYRRQLAKLGQPVDRSEWFMVPQEVNALFAPSQNSIIFPAAILEPTFFDGGQLRRHRRGDRPRDHPRLRQPWLAVRCARAAARLVDDLGQDALHRCHRPADRPVRRLQALPRRFGERGADTGREHRRRGGPFGGL